MNDAIPTPEKKALEAWSELPDEARKLLMRHYGEVRPMERDKFATAFFAALRGDPRW
jgi:hypothetical protein